jgi:hypothetical protein
MFRGFPFKRDAERVQFSLQSSVYGRQTTRYWILDIGYWMLDKKLKNSGDRIQKKDRT